MLPRARKSRQAEFASDRADFKAYMELRAQARRAHEINDAVIKLVNMGQLLPKTSPLRFLVLKEVANCAHPRKRISKQIDLALDHFHPHFELPAGYDAVTELAEMVHLLPETSPLRYLAQKEVGKYDIFV
jgi:hypothetical protein